jgi:A/G-specific adenine glycosylase
MSKRLNLPCRTVNVFRHDLVRWYQRNRRKLPWRDTQDPYKIWVSEIMLQQTRVESVVEYYRRWLREFPTIQSLARAPYSRVLKMWEGLGYYSRARNLHRAARCLMRSIHHGSEIPSDVSNLMQLPGIGRYTAGAIASIAFDVRAPIVDGNVARVFARVFGVEDSHWVIAEQLLPEKNCGDFNQALIELGALVCSSSKPRCERCPLSAVCLARRRGWQDRLPRRQRRKILPVTQNVLFVHLNGSVLLRQRPRTGLLAGMWELPAGRSRRQLLTLRHSITNRRITLRVFAGKSANGRWFTRRQLERLTMPAAHRQVLNRILNKRETAGAQIF